MSSGEVCARNQPAVGPSTQKPVTQQIDEEVDSEARYSRAASSSSIRSARSRRSGSVSVNSRAKRVLLSRLTVAAEAPQQVRASRMEVPVIVQRELIDEGKSGFWPVDLGDGDRTIQLDDG
jgi:hypothetical protein